ncbi:MAG: CDP-alcohol phosphatidyltransferase [Rhodospirillaceae bacterium]|jgi:phosphatidylglycerophosphate synthase|nr:CDP-alcohol phosphatidyltransferase [Rhodospirillaceae bacterium]|tara:strand:+ start:860 stop:1495 length:636 start_codon:yes stop_codon:yes gene_type:complete
MKIETPWDQQIASVLVKPLVKTPVRPNHLTTFSLCLAILGAALLATADEIQVNWGAGVFVLSRFLDHFDGELARLQGTSSKFGYYFDYVVGGIGYAALFTGLGIGHLSGDLGNWAILLGAAGAASALISLFSNLGIDQRSEDLGEGEAIGYPDFLGFELEDGIYLLAPITWLGFLTPFFVAAGIGASIYCLWTIRTFVRLDSKKPAEPPIE